MLILLRTVVFGVRAVTLEPTGMLFLGCRMFEKLYRLSYEI